MMNRSQYAPCPAGTADFCRLWSRHVDTLERHLSINRWALAAVAVVVIAYPVVQLVSAAILHSVVPDVVQNLLKFL